MGNCRVFTVVRRITRSSSVGEELLRGHPLDPNTPALALSHAGSNWAKVEREFTVAAGMAYEMGDNEDEDGDELSSAANAFDSCNQ